jgi:hypothetical protein
MVVPATPASYPTIRSTHSAIHHCMSYYSLSSTSTTSVTPIHSPRPTSPIAMAEPQPAEVQEGAADPHAPTGTAEDRKAAAALSTLDVQEEPGAKKEIDPNALNKAMNGLDIKGKKSEENKTVKVEAADVNLLVRGCTSGLVFVSSY